MAVRTQLTWSQKKRLENHFGSKLCLLYKASVHGFSLKNLLQKCDNQGPAIIVTYGDNYVTGAYVQGGFQNKDEDEWGEREKKGITLLRENLLSAVRTHQPYGDLVPQVRILLLGPIGAGKSSFVNSVKSVFRGHITTQALVGSNVEGTSKTYRTYSFTDGNDGSILPFVLCDSLGLSQTYGLCINDINSILKGHMPDRYKFESKRSITPESDNYIQNPLLKDRIHCVAFVFDANSVENLSYESVTWIKKIRREIIKCGIAHVALLTHVDTIELIRNSDFLDIYSCKPVKLKLETVHLELGFALSDILVVSNYVSEWELNSTKDVLILSALRQMLWAADDFLEDL